MSSEKKSVFITGSNRGIGLELASQHARDGWKVFASCRAPAEASELQQLQRDYGDSMVVLQLDVADFSQVEKVAQQLSGEALNLVINNAGVYGQRSSFDSTDYDWWMEVFRVNTMSSLKLAQSFAENIAKSSEKKFAAITSKMGSIEDNTSGGSYIYRSSKAALNIVLKSLSVDLQEKGIAVAAIHPGWVQTDMGGSNARTSVQESVSGIRSVLNSLTLANSGHFYAFDGTEIPW